jgi:hypothetical protein
MLAFCHTAITTGGFSSKRILIAHTAVVSGGLLEDYHTGVVKAEFWRSGLVPSRAGIVLLRCQRFGVLLMVAYWVISHMA